MSGRVLTGYSELDSLVGGGFLRNSMILIAGNPGTGKTMLSTKFIYEGATKYGDRGVYVCFTEAKRNLIQRMQGLAWILQISFQERWFRF